MSGALIGEKITPLEGTCHIEISTVQVGTSANSDLIRYYLPRLKL